jgi:MutS domain V
LPSSLWNPAGSMHRLRAPNAPEGTHAQTLDPDAWADLDPGDVFSLLDRTLSGAGQHALYAMLRRTIVRISGLEHVRERARRSAYFLEHVPQREEVQLALQGLGDVPAELLGALWGKEELRAPPRWIALPALLAAAAPLAFLASPEAGLIAVGLMMAVNILLHSAFLRTAHAVGPVVAALRRLLTSAHQLTRVEVPWPLHAQLRSTLAALVPLERSLQRVPDSSILEDTPLLYVKVFFLLDALSLVWLARAFHSRRGELVTLFDCVGELDAAQALASVRAGEGPVVEPVLSAEGALRLEAVRHPLLPTAVANDLDLARPLLVTGANMSGKSTLLRTIGVNVVLAQTVGFCFAQAYSGPLLRVGTCLRRSDSLSRGDSDYQAEARRVLQLVQLVQLAGEPSPALLLMDELFRGTNSDERTAASAAVLEHLAGRGACLVAATHDVALARALQQRFRVAHLGARASPAGLGFDYLVHPGHAPSGNALALLEALGYPGSLLQRARRHLAAG